MLCIWSCHASCLTARRLFHCNAVCVCVGGGGRCEGVCWEWSELRVGEGNCDGIIPLDRQYDAAKRIL